MPKFNNGIADSAFFIIISKSRHALKE